MENTDYKYYKNILDKLLNSDFAMTRENIARQGYGLDKLVNDKSELVREEVARQGYGLDKLVNDKDRYVRNIAKEMLKKGE